MPYQDDDEALSAWPFIVLFVVVMLMLVVSNALYEQNHKNEAIEDAPATARTLEFHPAPGTDVYVNGKKCP